MTDREKVIKALNDALTAKKNYPWAKAEMSFEFIEMLLELLKEQEAVKPRVSTAEQRCGNCNKVIEMDGWITCPWCGKSIKWEGR